MTDFEAPIPFLDLRAQYAGLQPDLLAAVTAVFEQQQFILGPQVEALENELANWLDGPLVITCASGTDALHLALLALEIGSGDEVITTPFSFFATAGAIALAGACPVFVDIDPVTFNLDPAHIESAITSRTRALLPVHIFGLPADMDAIQSIAIRHNLMVIEDAAQAIGAKYQDRPVGTIGNIGCFSFYPTKNLGGAGDGGMLATRDEALARRLRLLRVHGSNQPYHHELLGLNSRLDVLQAAVLGVKLSHLSAWNQARRQIAQAYWDLMLAAGLDQRLQLPSVPSGSIPVWHQFVVRLPQRDAARDFLSARGIATQIYYPVPLHLQPALSHLGYQAGDFPHAERTCREVLALPIYPELTPAQQRQIVAALSDFFP